ncbi:hypothetical protein LMG28614_06230 [Paraburkholderia ultramafica]|uniref:OmpR/PhoB-type domain-containing protein n=1 Tax=Paraburkholderia ultramafica TaxID=1544867 RepID=A0A6S7BM47_9BURK|nr:winged helix-turn-helix domain-containing protein [Paraburkholderia ultramafica]CAB3805595.1 hypothetical protein LMG28614_06230 [Paraburkholderia ultramafica]
MTVTERPTNCGTSMIELGRFQIDLAMRTLRQSGAVVPLGSRAFDILAALVSAAGRLVTKDELLRIVWPETIVEENNIQVHLCALRKILGTDRDLIVTIPGRGYRLRQRPITIQAPAVDSRPIVRRRLPPRETRLTGRDAAVCQIRMLLQGGQVLTLVGAGGIGKTSLAMEVAHQVWDEFSEAVYIVELVTATTQGAILCEIAKACGLASLDAAVSIPQLAAALSGKRMLLVLDNAEHVIDAVAQIVDTLVAESEVLRVLVTSREPLRVMPETMYRVEPLDIPSSDSTDAEILQCSAVRLLLLRVNSTQRHVEAVSADVHLIGEICRRLDGIPLAIELAAARVAALGFAGVHRYLNDRFALLTGGYRTALPRHQTLRATFDWSFAILDPDTRSLFRRLAIFGGSFTFEAMCAVACDEEQSVANAISGITELVAKSLVNVEFHGPVRKYRLSESTRAYAMEKLLAEGELRIMTSRNAHYLARCFQAQTDGDPLGDTGNPTDLQQVLDDARAAFDWAFSPEGDVRVGVELASNLAGTLLDAGLIEECCTRAVQAVDALEALPARSVDAAVEMRVRGALASALPYVRGPIPKAAELWREVLAFAVASGDQAFYTQALWGLWNTKLSVGNINESMSLAKQFQQVAERNGTPWQKVLADQMIGISLHCHGRHTEAKQRLTSASQRFMRLPGDGRPDGRFAVNPVVFCNGTLARIAWLQGDPDAATALVDTLVDAIRPETIEPSLTHLLGAIVIPLALMSGDLRRGSRYIDLMRSQAALHGFAIWLDYCTCLAAYRDILDGRAEQALPVLEAGLDALKSHGFRRLVTPLIVTYAETLIEQGRVTEASNRLNEALDFCQSNGELFFLPEVWRALGVAAQAEAEKHAHTSHARRTKIAAASSCFSKALHLAREQDAKMWELRASMAMAHLLDAQGQTEEAVELLIPIAADLESAAGTSDVRKAHELLGRLSNRCGKSGARQRPADRETAPPAYSFTTE